MTKYLFLVPLMIGCSLSLAAEARPGRQAAKVPPVDPATLPAASSKTGVTYATDIKPIFDKSCVRCHGAEKPKARLRLDSLDNVLKGGEHGKVLTPGNSAGSQVVHGASHVGNPDLFMPPPGNRAGIPKLTAEQVGLIRAWIDQGAK